MPVKNPKEKGNAFERKVAKMLSEWSGVKFMRTPMSGAIHNFKDKRVVSDIVPPLALGEFPFSIECKNVNCSWEFSTFLEGTSQTLEKHWKQCIDDALREGLLPLLVFTKNFRGIYAALNLVDFKRLKVSFSNYLEIHLEGNSPIIIVSFTEFLEKVNCMKMIEIFSSHKTNEKFS